MADEKRALESRRNPIASYLTRNYDFSTQDDSIEAMSLGQKLFEAGLRLAARIVRERKGKYTLEQTANYLEAFAESSKAKEGPRCTVCGWPLESTKFNGVSLDIGCTSDSCTTGQAQEAPKEVMPSEHGTSSIDPQTKGIRAVTGDAHPDKRAVKE